MGFAGFLVGLNVANSRNPFTNYISNSELSTAPPSVLFPDHYDIMMSWKTPISAVLIYTFVVKSWNATIKSEKISRVVAKSSGVKAETKTNPLFTAFIFLHNITLCLYSAWTFLNTIIPFYRSFQTLPFWDAFCDRNHVFWDSTLGLTGYYFYLSKYYEFIDTLIILLKGRKSSTLQTYHHAGAILTMYLAINYKSSVIWVFVIFNSFVHTIMYFYYAMTTIGITPPGKQYLTRLQITQFLSGMVIGLYYLLFSNDHARGGECFVGPGARAAIWATIAYAMPLTWLFFNFARKVYGRKTAVKEIKVDEKERRD